MNVVVDQVVENLPPPSRGWQWATVVFLCAVFYLATPLNVMFSTTDTFNVMDDNMTVGDRAAFNADATAQGSVGRQLSLVTLAAFGGACIVLPSERRLRIQGLSGVLIIAFLGWAIVSIVWSDEAITTLRKLAVLISMAFGALGVAKQFSLRHIVQFTLVAAGSLFAAGIVSELVLRTFRPWDPGYRFAGLTWPAFTAWTLSLLILAAMVLYPTAAKHRAALLLLIVTALGGLAMTKTRAAAAAFAVAVAAYAALTWPIRRTILVSLALLASTTMGVLVLELTTGHAGDILVDVANFGRTETVEGISGRSQLWQDLTPYVVAHPLIGCGYNSFWTPDRLVQIGEDNWGAPDAHNGYINLTLGVGLIGTGAYLLVLLTGLCRSWAACRATGTGEYAFACGAIIISAINTGFVSTQLAPAIYSFITLVIFAHLGFIDDPSHTGMPTS